MEFQQELTETILACVVKLGPGSLLQRTSLFLLQPWRLSTVANSLFVPLPQTVFTTTTSKHSPRRQKGIFLPAAVKSTAIAVTIAVNSSKTPHREGACPGGPGFSVDLAAEVTGAAMVRDAALRSGHVTRSGRQGSFHGGH